MQELSVTTYIDAPAAKVWDAMANQLDAWFCPDPWKCEVLFQEKRAGGASKMMFRGPNGEEMPQEGLYLAWEEGRRFVSTDAITADFEPSGPFMIGIWEIEPEGKGTRFTGRARHWTKEDRDKHEEMGFDAGWGAAAQQLKALCEAEGTR